MSAETDKQRLDERISQAMAYHKRGFNCAQAVACVFAEEMGRDEKEVFQIMEAFGFGMGTMTTCGALSGMAAVIGMKESDGDLEKPKTKKNSYRVSKELIRRFQEQNGSIICRELKGVDTKKLLRSCNGCIEDCVRLTDAYLNGEFDALFEEMKAKEAAKAAAKKAAAAAKAAKEAK